MKHFACLASFATLSSWTAAAPAQPAESAPRRDVEVLLQGGFGFGGKVDDSDVNRYGAAVGARGGVTLAAPRIYLGGSFVRFFGSADPSGEYHTTTADLHVGYDFRFAGERLLIRPELAGGVAQVATIQSDNAGYPLAAHVAPGLLAGLRVRPVLVFVQFRYDVVTGEWSNSPTLLAGAGALF